MKMGEIRMPGLHMFVVNQPDIVQRIMVGEAEKFGKHPLLGEMLEPLLGRSVFTTNGEEWRRQRDLLTPSFEMARVQHVFGLMQDAATDMVRRIEAHDLSKPYDVDTEMAHVTADIIFRTIMSVSIEHETARKIFDDFVLFQALSPKATVRRAFGLPRWWPFGRKAEAARLKAGRDIHAAIADVIRPRYEAAKAGNPGPERDILASILAAANPESGDVFTFDEVVDQISTMFLAGHETSASALMWSLYLLAFDPAVQEDARREVRAIKAESGGTLDMAAIRKMTLVRDVFREALRLYPPVGYFIRQSAETTTMRDKNVKAGSMVVVAPWTIHRHREYWDNPDGFDPYRFSKDRLKMPLKDCYMPFGMGPRVCIGLAFAMQEGVLILSTLLDRYEFSPVDGFQPQPVGRLTIRSENGLLLNIKRRDDFKGQA